MPGSAESSVGLCLWYLPTLSSAATDTLRRSLSVAETARLQLIRAPSRQRQYLAGHVLLRRLLSLMLPEWEQEHVLTLAPDGEQLQLQGPSAHQLDFNLSHSGDWIAAVVSRHCRVGVDIEMPRRQRDCLALAEAFFSPQEVAQLQAMPEQGQRDHFYRLWTLKESFLKAQKSGLSSAGLATAFVAADTASFSAPWFAYPFRLPSARPASVPLWGAVSLSASLSQPLPIWSWSGQGFEVLGSVPMNPWSPQP